MFLFFFFQAEDGIRDADVTGVQTCALPIWRSSLRGRPGFLRGLVITNNGCNSAHRASSTRQIVGSSLAVGGAGLGCVIETPPGAVKWPVLPLAYQTSDFLDSLLAAAAQRTG